MLNCVECFDKLRGAGWKRQWYICCAGYLFQKQQKQNKQHFIVVCVVDHSLFLLCLSVCLVALVMAGHTLLTHVVCGLIVPAMPVWLYLASNINVKLCIWLPWWSALFSLPHYFVLYLGTNYYPWPWPWFSNNVSAVVLLNISRLLFNEKSM